MPTNLPEPHFVDRDPLVILNETIASYEAKTQRPLEPTQVERLLIDVMVYRETLIRIAIQDAAKQNLIAFARYPMVDLLAQLLGGSRLPATPAKTTVRFGYDGLPGPEQAFPAGFRVRTADKKVTFVTTEDAVIGGLHPLTDDVGAVAVELGPIGNDYAAGQVNELVDATDTPCTVTNLTTTAGGSPSEDSDQLRERVPNILGEYATAGPGDAYRALARKAASTVLAAHVTTPEPGIARVTILARVDGVIGIPDSDLLDDVAEYLSDEYRRPLCDTVEVVATTAVDYAIEAELVLDSDIVNEEDADAADAVEAAAEAAAEAYAALKSGGMGRTPVKSQIIAALSVRGVHSVNLIAPAVEPTVAADAWARCTGITISVVGFASGGA